MSITELKLISEKRPTPAWRANPTEKMRQAVLNTIEVQRALIIAERTGTSPNLTKTVKRADENGAITEAVVDRKPRQWFWKNTKGQYLVEMLYAGQPVLINGKQSAIEAGDAEGVEKVLGVIATAVENGELDKALNEARSKRKIGRNKKVA